jgi:hypothetical protein
MRSDRRSPHAMSVLIVGLALLRSLRRPRPSKWLEASHRRESRRRDVRRLDDAEVLRRFWELDRVPRIIMIVAIQVYLWGNLFGVSRGAFTGPTYVIPWIVAVALGIFVLASVLRFGSLVDVLAALLFAFSTLMAIFSTLYWNYGTVANFSQRLTRLDAIYFTVGTMTTAGTGNINAISEAARGLQVLQMILDLGLLVFVVGLVVAELSSRSKNTTSRSESPPSS